MNAPQDSIQDTNSGALQHLKVTITERYQSHCHVTTVGIQSVRLSLCRGNTGVPDQTFVCALASHCFRTPSLMRQQVCPLSEFTVLVVYVLAYLQVERLQVWIPYTSIFCVELCVSCRSFAIERRRGRCLDTLRVWHVLCQDVNFTAPKCIYRVTLV